MYVKGEDPGKVMLDHIDGNPLNNRIENLRIASRETNLHNSKRRSDNTSGVKGVCFHKQTRKWRARVALNGVRHSLGAFDTLEQATGAIRFARVEMHGEFANHG
jgi:predicted lipoprotein